MRRFVERELQYNPSSQLSVFFCVFCVLFLPTRAWSLEQEAFIQPDISSARIIEMPQGYAVDVRILSSDFEGMFQKTMSERRGIDLSGPGLLEVEIGRFFAKRIFIRDSNGHQCESKVDKAGEDPSNDEGVLVSLKYECTSHETTYDARQFLSVHGARAWQIVAIVDGNKRRQVMINAESPPTPIHTGQ